MSDKSVVDAAEATDTAPETIVPEELVVSAEVPEQVPKVEASVVEPMFEMLNSVVVAEAVDEPIANSVVLVSPLLACTARRAYGLVEPTPNLPVAGKMPVPIPVPYKRLPMSSWLLALA